MGMKFSMVGETLRGFSIAREKGVYGVVEVRVDSKTICDYVSYRPYSYISRYIHT